MGLPPEVRDWLDQAVPRLAELSGLEAVYLFGSFARGRATRRSDLDLLVIWRTQKPPLERIAEVFDRLKDAPYPVELLVLTPEEFEVRKDLPFLRGVMREAVLWYERGKAGPGGGSLASASGR